MERSNYIWFSGRDTNCCKRSPQLPPPSMAMPKAGLNTSVICKISRNGNTVS